MLREAVAPMPLFSLSSNIQETEAASRKRLDDGCSRGSDVGVSIAIAEEFSHSENVAGPKVLDMSAPAIEHSSRKIPYPLTISGLCPSETNLRNSSSNALFSFSSIISST